MRLYVYVSESVNLSDLVPILETSKVSNMAHGITGLLSYNYGHYLQIIEGEDAAVSTLIKNMQKDSRHQNMVEILDAEVDERIFSDWSMNLVPLLKRNDSFMAFIDYLNNNIELLDRNQKRLMKIFHSVIDKKIPTAKDENPFKPLSYSITQWPDFDVVEPSSKLLSLCGTLMNNPKCFRQLTRQNIYGSQVDVRSMLTQLNKAGYLRVTQAQNLGQSHIEAGQQGYADKVHMPGKSNIRPAQLAAG